MKKLTALLLALVLALGLTACTRNDTKKLAGTWTYRADITERINQRVKEALELEQVSPDAAVSVYLTFTVTPDGAYTLALDTASIEKDRAAYMEALRPVLAEALYVQAEDEGYTREQYDEALESLGMTAEDCADTIIAAFDLNTFLTLLRGSHDSEGGPAVLQRHRRPQRGRLCRLCPVRRHHDLDGRGRRGSRPPDGGGAHPGAVPHGVDKIPRGISK